MIISLGGPYKGYLGIMEKCSICYSRTKLIHLTTNFVFNILNFHLFIFYMSRVMRKPAFCICENKDADQLCGNCTADQRLCIHYTDSAITLLPKSEISNLSPPSVVVQPGLCRTWSETSKTGYLAKRLIYMPLTIFSCIEQKNKNRW